MILTSHQPGYLPWLGLFDKIAQADVFVFSDDVAFDKADYQQRVRVMGQDGPLWLTVPTHAWSRRGPIRQVMIDNDQPWTQRHMEVLRQGYRRAPYWPEWEAVLDRAYGYGYGQLVWLNAWLFVKLMQAIRRPWPQMQWASDLKLEGTKTDRLIAMCRAVGADTYVFGAEGRSYADVEAMERAGIRALFRTYPQPEYWQGDGRAFVPGLSALDALCWLGAARVGRLLEEASLSSPLVR
jgi:hypothetical protein